MVVVNQLFVQVTSNLPLHMVMLIALLMYVQHTMICVQMAQEHSAAAIFQYCHYMAMQCM
jgi:hypothetical protein